MARGPCVPRFCVLGSGEDAPRLRAGVGVHAQRREIGGGFRFRWLLCAHTCILVVAAMPGVRYKSPFQIIVLLLYTPSYFDTGF